MLYRSYPGRFMMVAAVMFLNAMGGTPGGLLQSKYMQEAHGWTPANVSTLILTGGAIGLLGNVLAGNLSDQIGRRLPGVITLIVAPVMWAVELGRQVNRCDLTIGKLRPQFEITGALVARSSDGWNISLVTLANGKWY